MSTDYEAVCDVCKVRIHAGQRTMGENYAFGGSRSDEPGRRFVAEFMFKHALCCEEGIRVVSHACSPTDYKRLKCDRIEVEEL